MARRLTSRGELGTPCLVLEAEPSAHDGSIYIIWPAEAAAVSIAPAISAKGDRGVTERNGHRQHR